MSCESLIHGAVGSPQSKVSGHPRLGFRRTFKIWVGTPSLPKAGVHSVSLPTPGLSQVSPEREDQEERVGCELSSHQRCFHRVVTEETEEQWGASSSHPVADEDLRTSVG